MIRGLAKNRVIFPMDDLQALILAHSDDKKGALIESTPCGQPICMRSAPAQRADRGEAWTGAPLR